MLPNANRFKPHTTRRTGPFMLKIAKLSYLYRYLALPVNSCSLSCDKISGVDNLDIDNTDILNKCDDSAINLYPEFA